jgi:hypothetical protein
MRKYLLLAVLVLWGAYSWWTTRPISRAPGVLAPEAPLQEAVPDARSFEHKGYRVTPLAQISLTARVLGREDYYLGREARLAPTDLALGWARMSDEEVLKNISISQSNRFYYWRVKDFPVPQREIETSSANMHMIPADHAIERILKTVREGQLVTIRGYLVRIEAIDGWSWTSSLSREDTGNGSCELVWVQQLAVASTSADPALANRR